MILHAGSCVVSRRLAQSDHALPRRNIPSRLLAELAGLAPGEDDGMLPHTPLRVPSLPPLGSTILKPAGVRAASARNWFARAWVWLSAENQPVI
jgi:hypothetical protein